MSMEGQNIEMVLNAAGTRKKDQGTSLLELREGNTTFLISLYLRENMRATFSDKVKKLIRKDVQDGNF